MAEGVPSCRAEASPEGRPIMRSVSPLLHSVQRHAILRLSPRAAHRTPSVGLRRHLPDEGGLFARDAA